MTYRRSSLVRFTEVTIETSDITSLYLVATAEVLRRLNGEAYNTQLSREDAEDQNVIHILTAGASSE